MVKSYCTQNDGDCSTCSLVNYGLDCQNHPVGQGGPGRGQGRPATGAKPNRTMRLDDDEYQQVKELIKKLREMAKNE